MGACLLALLIIKRSYMNTSSYIKYNYAILLADKKCDLDHLYCDKADHQAIILLRLPRSGQSTVISLKLVETA